MALFGRGALKDIGKTFLAGAVSPAEMITGQNIYDPGLKGGFGEEIQGFQNGINQIGASIAPTALNAIAPGAGTALEAARGITPTLNSGIDQFDPNSKGAALGGLAQTAGSYANLGQGGIPNQGLPQGAGQDLQGGSPLQLGNLESMFQQGLGGGGQGGFGSQVSQMQNISNQRLMALGGDLQQGQQIDRSGASLATFNGPSHEQGGFPYAGAELEKKETVDLNEEFVYSDKLKVPGKKITFAKASKKYKGTDKDDGITKNTNKLMLEKLKNQQEVLKEEMFQKDTEKYIKKHGGYLNEHTQQFAPGGYLPPANMRGGVSYGGGGRNYGSAGVNYGGGNASYMMNGGDLPGNGSNYVNAPGVDFSQANNYINSPQPDFGSASNYVNSPGANFSGTDNYINAPQQQLQQGQGSNGFGNFDINQALQLAPTGYAFAKGAEEIDRFNPNYNPEYDNAINLAAGRRYDATPEIEAGRRAQKIANKAAIERSGGSAALALSAISGAQIHGNRSHKEALAREQNTNNQYQLQEAQLRSQLGSERAGADNQAQQFNLQALAARDAFTQKGFDGLGQQGSVSEKNDIYRRLLQAQYGDLGPMQQFAGKYSQPNR